MSSMMMRFVACGWIVLVGCKSSSSPPPTKETPPETRATTCEPARITLDAKPFAFDHGALAYSKDGTSSVRLFSSTNIFDGSRKPTDPTCEQLMSSEVTADYVEVTAIDKEPKAGILAYSFQSPLATGMKADAGPLSKCKPGSSCPEIDAEVITAPTGPRTPMAMCVVAKIRFTDPDKLEHVLAIDGRLTGTWCGVRPGSP